MSRQLWFDERGLVSTDSKGNQIGAALALEFNEDEPDDTRITRWFQSFQAANQTRLHLLYRFRHELGTVPNLINDSTQFAQLTGVRESYLRLRTLLRNLDIRVIGNLVKLVRFDSPKGAVHLSRYAVADSGFDARLQELDRYCERIENEFRALALRLDYTETYFAWKTHLDSIQKRISILRRKKKNMKKLSMMEQEIEKITPWVEMRRTLLPSDGRLTSNQMTRAATDALDLELDTHRPLLSQAMARLQQQVAKM
jgi:hypothetical protein